MTLKDSVIVSTIINGKYIHQGQMLVHIATQHNPRHGENKKKDIQIYELDGKIYYQIAGPVFELISPLHEMKKYYDYFMKPDKKWLKLNYYELV